MHVRARAVLQACISQVLHDWGCYSQQSRLSAVLAFAVKGLFWPPQPVDSLLQYSLQQAGAGRIFSTVLDVTPHLPHLYAKPSTLNKP